MATNIKEKNKFISIMIKQLATFSDEKEASAYVVLSLQSIDDCHILKDSNDNTSNPIFIYYLF